MWTLFWDMSSGGGSKEKWDKIYIELPQAEAEVYFYNRFGHNPNRVSCTCCGPDYTISEDESLKQLSGFHRNAECTETKTDPDTGLYLNDDPNSGLYLDPGEDPPEGYKIDDTFSMYREHRKFISVEDYKKLDSVLVVPKEEIDSSMCTGEVPEQGYVWRD